MHYHKDYYDVGAHSSLPTSVVIAVGLLEKNEEKDNEQFCVRGKKHFLGYLVLHKRISAVLRFLPMRILL